MKEEEYKKRLLEEVKIYVKKYHSPKKDFEPGNRILYAQRIFNEEEVVNLVDSSLEFWLTSGRYTKQFETEFAKFLNVKYCSLVNSGSSANLLAFMSLTSPLLKERRIKRGDEIITVAAGFPTTIAPIVQYGAIPVFVDITIPDYNIDCDILEKTYTNKLYTSGNP